MHNSNSIPALSHLAKFLLHQASNYNEITDQYCTLAKRKTSNQNCIAMHLNLPIEFKFVLARLTQKFARSSQPDFWHDTMSAVCLAREKEDSSYRNFVWSIFRRRKKDSGKRFVIWQCVVRKTRFLYRREIS